MITRPPYVAAALVRQEVADRRALRLRAKFLFNAIAVSGRARLGDWARQEAETHRPIEGAMPGAGAFEEQIVEVPETVDELVITKTAQVVEEW